MADYTQHYNLEQPDKSEYYDIDVQNNNMNIIDQSMHELDTSISNLDDATVKKVEGKNLSTNDYTNYEKNKNNIKVTKLTINTSTQLGATVTLPVKYKVGADTLEIYLYTENGNSKLLKCSSYNDANTGMYSEVGSNNAISNQIKITNDWKLDAGDILELIVKGEWD